MIDLAHGTGAFIAQIAVTTAGVITGLRIGRAPISKFKSLPFIVIYAFFVAAVGGMLINWIFHDPLRNSNLQFVIGPIYLFIVSGFIGRIKAKIQSDTYHKRGTFFADSSSRPSRLLRPRGLTLAGQPVDPLDETKHFKLIGTTGTGKSTAIRELLRGAIERGDRAVIADPDGSYLRSFYDPKRGDVILNPFDSRSARWDLFAEMQTHFDADQVARSLIADTEGNERNWRNYARVFLTSVLRQLHRVKHDDVAELHRLLSTTPVDDLRDLLNDTAAGPYLSQDNGKFFGAVRAVANTHLAALELIAHQESGDHLSVRNWVRSGGKSGAGHQKGILFLPYHANEIATLSGLISTWMRLAIFETMSNTRTENASDQRLWFVVDELDALGQIDGLKDALARLRKFGGRCVLGFQSIAQVSGTYGQSEAQTIVENCGNTLILRCSSSENGGTARFASKLIGEREIIREQRTYNDGGGIFSKGHHSVSFSDHYVTESAVLPSQIEQLPDLCGYLKLASQPGWMQVALRATT